MPKVSIIVPTYNVEQYLNECMESIVNQTLQDIEVICVDDGSTDNSGKILDESAAKDNRVKVIHKENGGYGKAMNVGLDNATGEYIGIVEPDDFVELNMYEELYKIATLNDVDFIKADFNRFTGEKDNRILNYNRLDGSNKYYNKVVNPQENIITFKFIMNTWSGIYKREFIEKYHIRHNETPGASFQDNGFWFQTFSMATRAYFYNKPFYMNRRDNINSSVKSKGKVYAMKVEYDWILEFLKANSELYSNLIGIYWYKKYCNYVFTYNRIDIKFKKEWIELFAKEFKKGIKSKEIDPSLFSEQEYKNLCKIIKNPKKYYYKSLNRLSLLEKLFSIKNSQDKTYKIITILDIKIKIAKDNIKKLLFFGNVPSKGNKWYKVIYILGIKFSFRNKRKEKRMADIRERKLLFKNLDDLKKQNRKLEKQFKIQQEEFEVKIQKQNDELMKQNSELREEIKSQQENFKKQNDELKNYVKQIEKKTNLYNKILYTPKINKEKIYSEMQNRSDYKGITDVKRNVEIIVSLTSFPERMYDIHYALYSLLNQSVKPDKLILWLSEEQFPNKENDIPNEVLKLKNNGLTIRFIKDVANIKSYKKLIPALNEYPNDIIVTADDDLYYPKDWIEKLYTEYQRDQRNIICHRAHKITLDNNMNILPYSQWQKCIDDCSCSVSNFCTTGGGVLYPPNSLHKDVCNEQLFIKLSPNGDDIWFWAMAILNNKKIKMVENPINKITYINPERELGYSDETTLYMLNKTGNDIQIKNVVEYYPQILDRLSTFNSADYWEQRYNKNGNSGAGSYDNLADFKAEVINSFVKENNITSVIEFGCGDGNQLSLFDFKSYIGYDVSATVLKNIKAKFADNINYNFDFIKNYTNQKADLSISLDVIYHLIEDDIYTEYMNNLFNASNKYVIIYSSNIDKLHCKHVKHRKFTAYVDSYYPQWTCIKKIDNKYPYDEADQKHTSFADFYIYKKLS